jgi:serine/threonine-protein kinase
VGGILYEMLSGKPAYEGSNFMEILHKKANERPTALASFRTDIPGEIEALVARTMAKDPAVRPQTMAALEELLLQALASGHFPAEARYRIPGSGGAWRPAVLGRIPIGYAAGWRSLAAHPRKLVGLGAAIVTLFALVGIGVARSRVQPAEMPGIGAAAEPVPSPAPTPLPALAAPPESPPEPAPATAPVVVGSNVDSPAAGEDAPVAAAAEAAADARPAAIAAAAAARAARAEAAAQKRELAEAQQLLHAQRFAEARAAFSRLTRSGPTRGPALLALAEIAFQEKNYEEAVRSARLAADRGGGARARVVLGDAHFRLSRYQEAVTAYEQALRLDPRNASARTGLALAGKRL